MDDLEQYGRSNCLIIHGCKIVLDSKPGKTPETEKYTFRDTFPETGVFALQPFAALFILRFF